VNVSIRNIGLQSRPNGKKNPIWKMISSVMSSLYEMELENIAERTATGRQVFDLAVTFYLLNQTIVYNAYVEINVIFPVGNLPTSLN